MPDFGLQLSTVRCVGALELADEFQVQTYVRNSEVVKVNVAPVCFSVLFWYESREIYMGKTSELRQVEKLLGLVNLVSYKVVLVFVLKFRGQGSPS